MLGFLVERIQYKFVVEKTFNLKKKTKEKYSFMGKF
jgi:hypothetical protein